MTCSAASTFLLAHPNIEVFHLDISSTLNSSTFHKQIVFLSNSLPRLRELRAQRDVVSTILKGVKLSSSEMKNPLFFVNLRRFGSHALYHAAANSMPQIVQPLNTIAGAAATTPPSLVGTTAAGGGGAVTANAASSVGSGAGSAPLRLPLLPLSALLPLVVVVLLLPTQLPVLAPGLDRRRCDYHSFPCRHYCWWWWWCCYCQRSFRCWLRGWIGAAVTTTPSLVGTTAAGAGAGGAVTAIRCWLRGWIGNRFLFINNKIDDDDGQFLRKFLSRVADIWQSPTSRPRLGEVLQPSHVHWCEGRRDREKQGGPGRQSDRQRIGGPSGKWRFTLPSPSLRPSESSFSYLQSVTSSSSRLPLPRLHPLRTPLLSSTLSRNVLKLAPRTVQTLYHALAVDFKPLTLRESVAPLLEELGGGASRTPYASYLPLLHQALLSRLLAHLSEVYSSIKISFFIDLLAPLYWRR
ncbi:hypothetical protein F5051DRAFT_484681 [Lentinula edodes]|nr:hypothetical protein F5051DRAFT_484681 [Lentinula edodes]